MDLSGIIFVLLALAWAVYLIPQALKHHDEVARTRSIDRFSSAMRVLAHREPVDRHDSRLIVAPARPANRPRVDTVTHVEATPVAEITGLPHAGRRTAYRVRVSARRTAVRAAARRRRRILTFLLLCTAVTAGTAYLAYAPWWSVSIPGGLTLVYLVRCRTQVRHQSTADSIVAVTAPRPDVQPNTQPAVPAHAHPDSRQEARPVVPADAVAPVAGAIVDRHRVVDLDDEDTVGIPVAMLQAALVPTEDGGTLWDPLPVTLPTYVTKPRAHRTVRTIDLGEPGTWTSGRTADDALIVAQAAEAEAAAEAAEAGPAEGGQHVVGS